MDDEKVKKEEEHAAQKQNDSKKSILIILSIIIILFVIFIFVLARPLKDDCINCEYKGKFNKIVCVQTEDVVPQWLQLEDNPYLRFIGMPDNYSMKLIFSHDNKDYYAFNMTEKEFIPNMNRKFIYEAKEQNFSDWLKFKWFTVQGCNYSNYGSLVLFCSDKNMQEDICKKLKRQYKNK